MKSSGTIKHKFTLIEMVVVISIMALVLTIAVVKLTRPPASVQIEDAAQSIRLLLVTGKMRAAAKGVKMYLLYENENGRFRIAENKNPENENDTYIESRYLTYILPDDMEFTQDEDTGSTKDESDKMLPVLPDYSINGNPPESGLEDAQLVYTFLVSGLCFGSDIKLKMFGHQRTISGSQLTGVISVRDTESDEAER